MSAAASTYGKKTGDAAVEIAPLLDWSFVQSLALSLALGAIVGLERQSHYDPEQSTEPIGVRTFALASLLGTISVLAAPMSPALPWIIGLGYLALVLAFLFFEAQEREGKPGITTQISALLVYAVGVLVPSEPVLAAVSGVIVVGVLSVKEWTHRLVENLTDEEVEGTVKFLLISVVVLPILPTRPVDPWGIYHPQEIWFLVVLISGISFIGYFAIRFFGRDRGIALTGALGGLASSTAVTLSMCHRVRASAASDDGPIHRAAAFAILVASGIMTVRVAILVMAVDLALGMTLLAPLAALAVPGGIVAAIFWRRINDSELVEVDDEEADGGDALDITNPFQLTPALKFGGIFVVIIGVVYLARQLFGQSGAYAASFLSGLVNMDAVSVAVARMLEAQSVVLETAVNAVIIGVLANSMSKAVMSWLFGSRRLGLYVAGGLIPTVAVGVGVIVLL